MTRWQHITLATMGLATAGLVASVIAAAAVLFWQPAFDSVAGWLSALGLTKAKEMPPYVLAIALPFAGFGFAQGLVWLQQRCMAVLVHFALKRLKREVEAIEKVLGEDAALKFAEHKFAAMIDGAPAPASFDVFGARDVIKKITTWRAGS